MSYGKSSAQEHLIGVVSDTHGLLRPEVREALRGCELIIHAGDVDQPEVLEGLKAIAPVVAVRGNMDRGAWARQLSKTEVVEVGEVLLYVLHDRHEMDLDPAAAGFRVVVSGHTHAPALEGEEVLYVNPGAAGPSRFNQLVTVARLHIRGNTVEPEVLRVGSAAPTVEMTGKSIP